MKQILQITGQLAKNGTETFIVNLLNNINRSKYHFDFLVGREMQGGYYEEVRKLGSDIHVIPFTRLGLLKNWKKINKFFKENANKYDAVHFHGNSFCSLEVLLLAKHYGIKNIIVHAHNSKTFGFYNKILHKLYRHYIDKIATYYLACSDLAREWGYKGSIVYNKSVVIPNGIDLIKYRYDEDLRKQARREFMIGNGLVIGTVGRLTEVKNQTFLIDIFNIIFKNKPDSYLMIIGDGELKEELKQKVKDLHIEKNVIFTGVRSDVPFLLNALDAFVLPSLYEGLPFVGIEAQANGLPTFISDNVSKQIVLSSNTHLLNLSTDSGGWAKYIMEHVNVGRTIDDSVSGLKEFSISKTVRIMECIYDSFDSKEFS